MKKQFFRFLLPLVLPAMLVYSSCDEDSFSQVVEIDIPPHESLPVLVSGLNAGDTLVSVLISRSKGVLEAGPYELPSDAVVRLLRNGQELARPVFNPASKHYEIRLAEPLPAGDASYRIEAQLTGSALVFAEQEMPRPPAVAHMELRKRGTVTAGGSRADEIIIDIDDPAGEENYYRIEISELFGFVESPGDTIFSEWPRDLETNDPNLYSGGNSSMVISDGPFNGRRYRIRVSTYPLEEDEQSISRYRVRVFQISRDAFLYERTLYQFNEARGNPFAEPVTVHSNIRGGYGIFHMGNGVTRELF